MLRRLPLVMCFALLATAGLGACGSDDDPAAGVPDMDNLPTCSSVFGEGEKADAKDLDQMCTIDGEAQALGTGDTKCDDGRTLWWNDFAWAYEGDVWHEHEDGAEQVAPEAERLSCTPE